MALTSLLRRNIGFFILAGTATSSFSFAPWSSSSSSSSSPPLSSSSLSSSSSPLSSSSCSFSSFCSSRPEGVASRELRLVPLSGELPWGNQVVASRMENWEERRYLIWSECLTPSHRITLTTWTTSTTNMIARVRARLAGRAKLMQLNQICWLWCKDWVEVVVVEGVRLEPTDPFFFIFDIV